MQQPSVNITRLVDNSQKMDAGFPEGDDLYTEAVTAINGWNEKGLGKTVSNKRYEQSARKYDQYMKSTNHQGPSQLAKTMTELYPSNRDVIKILDVASGTGLAGLAMWKAGFRQMDAVDPSQGMLDVAKDKSVYNRLICDFVDNEHQLDIKENTYDAVTIVGGMGENNLPSGAFGEIIRVVKPGGFIVNVTRTEHFTIVDDYRNNLAPYFRKLEDDRKWKEESRRTVQNILMDCEGIVIVHRVLS